MTGPVKPDDADEKWEGYPGHTRAKHNLVRYYLEIWFRKLGRPDRKMRVFDCFAGRGEYYPDERSEPLELEHIESKADFPGSPQLILDTVVGRSSNVGEIECIFIEKKHRNAELLRENLPDRRSLPHNVDYRVVEGKFQEETPRLVGETGGWVGPSFFFIDPFGYEALEYDVVTELSSPDQFEIFVNLMASQVIRWEDAEKHHSALENLFGTPDWHAELEEHEPNHWNDKEVSYYCYRLREEGPEYTLAYLVTEEDTKAMKYYLVFGTNSTHGVEAMHDSMQNCGIGEYAYAPKRQEVHEEQRGLTTFSEKQRREKLKQTIKEDFAGRSISFDELVRTFVAEKDYPSSQRQDIRKVAKELEADDEIFVNRITSSTERGLGGDDILKFTEPSCEADR